MDLYFESEGPRLTDSEKANFTINADLLLRVGHFVARRIRTHALNYSFRDDEVRLNEHSLSQKYLYDERFERRMKINSKMDLRIRLDKYYKAYNDTLIFRRVFTMKPLKIFCVLYNEQRQTFLIILYDNNGCELVKRPITMKYIKIYIPYAEMMIRQNLFVRLGERIFLAFKNLLIMENQLHEGNLKGVGKRGGDYEVSEEGDLLGEGFGSGKRYESEDDGSMREGLGLGLRGMGIGSDIKEEGQEDEFSSMSN
jgi:hypothetical protein